MTDFRLTAQEIAVLKAAHRKQRDKLFAYRLNVMILLDSGWSVSEVTQALLVDEKTIYHWLEKYRQGGTDQLFTLYYSGKEPLLTEKQQELAKHLDEHTYLTTKEIRQYVKKTYRVAYSRNRPPTSFTASLHDSLKNEK